LDGRVEPRETLKPNMGVASQKKEKEDNPQDTCFEKKEGGRGMTMAKGTIYCNAGIRWGGKIDEKKDGGLGLLIYI